MMSFEWNGTDEESSSIVLEAGELLVGLYWFSAAGGGLDVHGSTTKLTLESSEEPTPAISNARVGVADADAVWKPCYHDDLAGTRAASYATVDATTDNAANGADIAFAPIRSLRRRRLRLVSDQVEADGFIVYPRTLRVP